MSARVLCQTPRLEVGSVLQTDAAEFDPLVWYQRVRGSVNHGVLIKLLSRFNSCRTHHAHIVGWFSTLP